MESDSTSADAVTDLLVVKRTCDSKNRHLILPVLKLSWIILWLTRTHQPEVTVGEVTSLNAIPAAAVKEHVRLKHEP
jgi:hypothetical protein